MVSVIGSIVWSGIARGKPKPLLRGQNLFINIKCLEFIPGRTYIFPLCLRSNNFLVAESKGESFSGRLTFPLTIGPPEISHSVSLHQGTMI